MPSRAMLIEKWLSMMRTQKTCSFSFIMSPGTSLTCVPVRLLTDLSAMFLADLSFPQRPGTAGAVS